MKFQATPFTMTEHGMTHPERVLFPSADVHRVGSADEYRQRVTVEVEASSAEIAAEGAWQRYQNIDKDHVTPDGDMSMQTGDLVQIVDVTGTETWWMTCSFGFCAVQAPEGLAGTPARSL